MISLEAGNAPEQVLVIVHDDAVEAIEGKDCVNIIFYVSQLAELSSLFKSICYYSSPRYSISGSL